MIQANLERDRLKKVDVSIRLETIARDWDRIEAIEPDRGEGRVNALKQIDHDEFPLDDLESCMKLNVIADVVCDVPMVLMAMHWAARMDDRGLYELSLLDKKMKTLVSPFDLVHLCLVAPPVVLPEIHQSLQQSASDSYNRNSLSF